MSENDALRKQLAKILDWEDAHVHFDKAVAGIAPAVRGVTPSGLPYSAWQLLEHLRLTQRDILEFCRNPAYVEQSWPDDYWPSSAAPPSERAWDESIAAYREDREAFKKIAADPKTDLFKRIPHGAGQTYLRELLLVADHNSYHVGQLIVIRRALGIWPSA